MQQTMSQDTSDMMGGARKQKGLIAGMVAMAILACGGIGFGIYGMNEANKKSSEISDLRVQIEDKDGTVTTLETDEIKVSDDAQTITISDSNVQRKNPVISAEPPVYFYSVITSGAYDVDGAYYKVELDIQDGEINNCKIYNHNFDGSGEFNRDCNGINGFSGKIYKAVEMLRGQGGPTYMGFVMDNGMIEYIPTETLVTEVVKGGTANIKGTVDIDGFVTDAFMMYAGYEKEHIGGYTTTIFVLSDGSYIEYDESMLK